MPTLIHRSRRGRGAGLARLAGDRRGSALVLVLVMTVALAALALSAIVLGGHTQLVTKAFDRERDFRYATESAIAVGRSRLTTDAALVLGDSAPTRVMIDSVLTDANGRALPNLTLSTWIARTGSKTGEHGLYASVISEVRETRGGGAKFVRRLELMEENFARFLDWANTLARPGCFGPGEMMDGPVHWNVNICDYGARFRDTVSTSGVFSPASGIYEKGRLERQPAMVLPSLARLARLQSYAASGNFDLTAPTSTAATTARLRLDFVWWDLNGDGDAAGPEDVSEGFVRVYRGALNTANRVRADYRVDGTDDVVRDNQCGDWHWMGGRLRFFPVATHSQSWFRDSMRVNANRSDNRGDNRLPYASWTNNGSGTTAINNHTDSPSDGLREAIMRGGRASGAKVTTDLTPRCFPAGDPHLAATERGTTEFPATADRHIGGDSSTFTRNTGSAGIHGQWLPWPGPPVNWNAFPAATRPPVEMRPYLWPLDRGLNPGTKGVIYVNGTVAVSGRVRGRVTLYATGDITFVDDVEYSVDPSSDRCEDMLGIIGARQVTIADNGINTPQDPDDGGDDGNTWMDDDRQFTLHGVIMALDTFVPERFSNGPTNMSVCNGYNIGRGCLNQVGGSIVSRREVTYTGSGTGFMESRTYDRRTSRDSPPYFPTTGRYFDNRFYEVDPLGFTIDDYLRRIGQSGS